MALVSEEYPPFMFGGIASVCRDLALALSRNGVDTTVFCGKAEKTTTERVNDKLSIVRLPCLNFPPRYIWFQIQNFGLLSKLLREYTIIHIVNPEAGISAAYLGRRYRRNVVTSIHGSYFYSLQKYIASPFRHWAFRDIGYQFFGYPLNTLSHEICLRLSDKVAVCSRSTLKELEVLHPCVDRSKVSVIPNGIDFDAIDSDSPVDEDYPSVVYYGRLLWIKGLQYLVEATAYLKKDFPGIQVRIFGDGPFKDSIRKMISDADLGKNIQLSRFVPRNKLFKEIRRSSLVVLPSLQEAQPVSVLEAMACKKPVVAFDFPFARELITDNCNGFVAKRADARDLSDKIHTILADRNLQLKLGQNGYKHVKKEHDWNVLAQKYIQLYSNGAARPLGED